MSLREIVRGVESREKRLTVFDPPTHDVVDELRAYFASQKVEIRVASTDSDLSGYAVLSDDADDEVLAAVDLRHVDGTWEDGPPYEPIVEHLDDTTFTSFDVDQILGATREIEDRAWRKGEGVLHAGFQRTTAIRAQASVYEDLAASDLDIHAYATPSPDVPDIDGVTVHQEDTDEIGESWFVVFDGGGDPVDACALLAQERDDPGERRFYGFWTYDADLVDEILSHLATRYLLTA